MRPKILAIQFRKNETSKSQEQASMVREVGIYTDIVFVDSLDPSINWEYPKEIMAGFSGVLLGGSGDFDFDGNREETDEARRMSYTLLNTLRPLFQYIFDNDIPTLGICYGHQLLGAFAGAQVRYDEQQKKTRSHEVTLMVDKNDHFLFSDLPDSFQAHYGHKDVLDRVPVGAVLVMSGGESCKVSALQYKKNIYTLQFHPELNYEDMLARISSSPGYLPEGVLVHEVFKDEPDSNKILRNFSKFVALQSEAV